MVSTRASLLNKAKDDQKAFDEDEHVEIDEDERVENESPDNTDGQDEGKELAIVDDDVVPSTEITMDYTNLFTTMEHFASRDALLNWVRRVGNENNMVIVVKRSDNGSGHKNPRAFLACERGGAYRSFKGVRKTNGKEKKKGANTEGSSSKGRNTGSKKCGCPFMLKGIEVSPSQWILEVKCGTHNHPIATYNVGHSYAGRLSTEEEEFVINMSKRNAPPEFVLKMLKRKNANNHSTIRTIYNARKKHKVNQHYGRTQLQYLMSHLVENKYITYSRTCQKTDTLKELFFAHPDSIQLLRAFPKVLLIDSTYKKNKYRLPYFEIVGVTSTDISFSVASVYLEAERKDNYTWALGVLRDLLGESLPNVIISDLEENLMNAVASKFPESRHFLCTRHIDRDVLAKCKGDFTCDMQWEAFKKQFNNVKSADSEKDFEDAVRVLNSDFANMKKPVEYVMTQWINPYKEKFVKAWTNQVMHYGYTTTDRFESHYSALKRMLGSSIENFEASWVKIVFLFQSSHAAIKTSFTNSVSITQPKFASDLYTTLRSEVSLVALEKLFDEIKEVRKDEFDPSECKHILRSVYGLPCAHELVEYVSSNKPIPITAIDSFWRKLDMEESMVMVNDDVDGVDERDIDQRFSDVVNSMEKLYNSYDQSEKVLFLKRVRELASPVMPPNLIEPSPLLHLRAFSNSTKKGSEKMFENQLSTTIESCSIHDDEIVYELPEGIPLPMFEKKGHPKKLAPISRRSTRFASSGNFVPLMPAEFRPYIVESKNVKGDGHCGFRVVAALMGFGEDSWVRVRQDLMTELTHHVHLYEGVFGENGRVGEILDSLNCFTESAPLGNWFQLPYMGYLVASAYNVAFITLSTQISLTFLPLTSAVPKHPKSICMGMVNDNHFIQVLFGGGRPMPPIANSWVSRHLKVADGWKEAYETDQIS